MFFFFWQVDNVLTISVHIYHNIYIEVFTSNFFFHLESCVQCKELSSSYHQLQQKYLKLLSSCAASLAPHPVQAKAAECWTWKWLFMVNLCPVGSGCRNLCYWNWGNAPWALKGWARGDVTLGGLDMVVVGGWLWSKKNWLLLSKKSVSVLVWGFVCLFSFSHENGKN